MTNDPTTSFYWYDFETWGVDPKQDYPCQFAGIRTDLDFNVIGDPLNLYCCIPNDYLPHPQACLITGITPQLTQQKGLIEPDFIRRIDNELTVPNTCTLGYNSLRFDDEVLRFTYYRNFYDPYAREWQNNNSRWDLIDVVRATYAVRPDGIEWPLNDNGYVSFKLEALTQANGLLHANAHDALSDVYATIALAKRVKQAQPKFFNYLFENRKKHALLPLINLYQQKPLLHVSSKLPAQNGCCTWVLPLGFHPKNNNAVICIDLNQDISPLLNETAQTLHERLYVNHETLANNNLLPVPIKLVHLNKCPILLPAGSITPDRAEQLNLDLARCQANLNEIKEQPELGDKLVSVFEFETAFDEQDAEHALYSGGFFSAADKALMEQLRQDLERNINKQWQFDDKRLSTLLFRLRARYFADDLVYDEQIKWQQHRQQKLVDSGRLQDYQTEIMALSEQFSNHPKNLRLLSHLMNYINSL